MLELNTIEFRNNEFNIYEVCHFAWRDIMYDGIVSYTKLKVTSILDNLDKIKSLRNTFYFKFLKVNKLK